VSGSRRGNWFGHCSKPAIAFGSVASFFVALLLVASLSFAQHGLFTSELRERERVSE
jgi:hypothetical protein